MSQVRAGTVLAFAAAAATAAWLLAGPEAEKGGGSLSPAQSASPGATPYYWNESEIMVMADAYRESLDLSPWTDVVARRLTRAEFEKMETPLAWSWSETLGEEGHDRVLWLIVVKSVDDLRGHRFVPLDRYEGYERVDPSLPTTTPDSMRRSDGSVVGYMLFDAVSGDMVTAGVLTADNLWQFETVQARPTSTASIAP